MGHKASKCLIYTRTTPTATQTRAFASASPTIMPTAGNGSLRRPGVRAWQAIARSFMPFFRWWRGIVPFNVLVGQMPAEDYACKCRELTIKPHFQRNIPILHIVGSIA